jgi:peptide/nickel transport system permease protein
MLTYAIRRLIQSIPILFGISLLVFLIVQLAPGSPVDRFRVPRVPQSQIDALIRLWGLDQPFLPFLAKDASGGIYLTPDLGSIVNNQYFSWLAAFVQFPFKEDAWGYSFLTNQPVRDAIFERIPATAILMGTSLILTVIVSVPIGVIAAVKQYSWADKVISTFATIGYAIPSFLLGLYVLYFGGVVLGQFTNGAISFPLFGRQSLGKDGDLLDIAWHLVLPVTSLAIQSIAGFSRYLRASMLDVLRQDYVRTARAKGLSDGRVVYKHALRNGLIPLITLIGLSLPSLVAGAVITEFIFSYPGLGQLTITAISQNDYPVIYATSMIAGFFVILGNLLADVLYGVVDPRIKY